MGVNENRMGVIDLDYIVRNVIADRSETTMHNYHQYLQFAALGFINLNLYKLDSFKVAYLPVNKNMTVDLPTDYVSYNLIGICDRNGRTITLGLDKRMCLPRKTDLCGNILSSSEQALGKVTCTGDDTCGCSSCQLNGLFTFGFFFVPHFRGGQYVGERYGQGGGFAPGYFRIDKEMNQIVLNTRLCAECATNNSGPVVLEEIVLEYKSSGVDADGGALVPIEALLPLRAWVHLQIEQNNPKIAESKVQRRQDTYNLEYFKLSKWLGSFTASELKDVFYRSFKMGPKR